MKAVPIPGCRLGEAVEACNNSIAALASRVLVSARKLRDLKAAPEAVEIKAIEPVERTAHVFQTPALSSMPSNGNKQ